jgi:hypothetical protein
MAPTGLPSLGGNDFHLENWDHFLVIPIYARAPGWVTMHLAMGVEGAGTFRGTLK